MKKNKNLQPTKKLLGVSSLILLTVGSVDSIRNLPAIAMFGTPIIFLFFMAMLMFLLPSTLISAELAATWPEKGGVYIWVKHAFGRRLGFLAIWFQWIENVIWYPTILSFMAATISFLISPELSTNKFFLISVILVTFWCATAINLFGVHASTRLSSLCTIFGLLLPATLIISLGTIWTLLGNPVQLPFHNQNLIPGLNHSYIWVAITGTMMSFCGMEIATVHATNVKDPHISYPKALIISTVILAVTLCCGAISIEVVLPPSQINLLYGVAQSFHTLFAAYHLEWITPIVSVAIVIGTIGSIINWILAPTTGLSIAAADDNLPKIFARANKHTSPHTILIMQAIIVTLLMLVFLLIPSVNGSYWLLTAMTTQLYMLMYILMFSAAIYLRFKHPDKHRPFRIPGKNFGMIIVAGLGIIGSVIAFVVGFVPPESFNIGSSFRYGCIQAAGLIFLGVLPLLLRKCEKIFKPKSTPILVK